MAYINARLIAKPESNWLSAATIKEQSPSTRHQTHNLVSYFCPKITPKTTAPLTTPLIAPNFNFNLLPYQDIQKHISST